MQNIILFLTLVAICLYTWETYKLRLETSKLRTEQTKVLYMSFLSMQADMYNVPLNGGSWPIHARTKWPGLVQDIIENGKLDLTKIYASHVLNKS